MRPLSLCGAAQISVCVVCPGRNAARGGVAGGGIALTNRLTLNICINNTPHSRPKIASPLPSGALAEREEVQPARGGGQKGGAQGAGVWWEAPKQGLGDPERVRVAGCQGVGLCQGVVNEVVEGAGAAPDGAPARQPLERPRAVASPMIRRAPAGPRGLLPSRAAPGPQVDEAGETSTAQRACTGSTESACPASRRSDVEISAAPARSPRASLSREGCTAPAAHCWRMSAACEIFYLPYIYMGDLDGGLTVACWTLTVEHLSHNVRKAPPPV